MDGFNQNNQQTAQPQQAVQSQNIQQPQGMQQSYQQPQGQPYTQGYQQIPYAGQPQGFQQGYQQGYQQGMQQGQNYQQNTYAQQQSFQQGMQFGMYQQMMQQPQLSCGMNVVSLIFGILGLIMSIPAGMAIYNMRPKKQHIIGSFSVTYGSSSINVYGLILLISVGIFLFFGFLFGICGTAGKTRGKGMGAAGLILSLIGIGLTVFAAVTGALN